MSLQWTFYDVSSIRFPPCFTSQLQKNERWIEQYQTTGACMRQNRRKKGGQERQLSRSWRLKHLRIISKSKQSMSRTTNAPSTSKNKSFRFFLERNAFFTELLITKRLRQIHDDNISNISIRLHQKFVCQHIIFVEFIILYNLIMYRDIRLSSAININIIMTWKHKRQ